MSQQFLDIVAGLCRDMGGDRPLEAARLLEAGDIAGYLSLTRCDPSHYTSAWSYFTAAFATDILRKCANLTSPDGLKAKAIAEFYRCEAQCKTTNDRIALLQDGFQTVEDECVRNFVRRVRGLIRSTLGRLPDRIKPRFGPGSTFSDKAAQATMPDKITARPTITSSAVSFLPLWAQTPWGRLQTTLRYRSEPELVRGNRFTTVPKDSTKDRGICIEPSFNVFYQLGLGRVIRERLLGVGIDLNDGQDLHRAMAHEASISGSHATIDLSSASDTICKNLVKLLLPEDWHDALFCLRSEKTLVEGKWVHLEKFSSMGNGFTFELETLIFWALAKACDPEGEVKVYGDDIICRTEFSGAILSCLRYFGFSPNVNKTFVTGVFKESCGGDYFNGVSVRPHYVKELPHEPQHWIAISNGIRRAALQNSSSFGPWHPFWRTWKRCTAQLPRTIARCVGPSTLGDVVLHDEPEHWVSQTIHCIRYFWAYTPVTTPIPLSNWGGLDVALAAMLHGCPGTGPIPRDSVSGYKVKRVTA